MPCKCYANTMQMNAMQTVSKRFANASRDYANIMQKPWKHYANAIQRLLYFFRITRDKNKAKKASFRSVSRAVLTLKN